MIGVFVALPPDNPSTRGDEVGYVIEESGCWNCLKCTRARNRRNYHKRKAAQ